MKKIFAISLILVLPLLVVTANLATAESVDKTSVLIMFKQKIDKQLVTDQGGTVELQYKYHPAVSAELPEKAIEALRKNPNIDFIVEQPTPQLAYQNIPWGVEHIGALTVHSGGNTGEGVNVAILDTGMDLDHPDLSYEYAFDFYGSNDPDASDGHGHGTIVAGIIAALDNGIGVVGVAPDADLFILKVFDDAGNANEYVDIIEALEWCIGTYYDEDPNNNIQVVSMSWGNSLQEGDPGIQVWLNTLYNLGAVNVGAAGNNGLFHLEIDTVIYPARYTEVIAVGATQDTGNILAWFSSCGPAVELVAPGVNILSTYKGDSYTTIEGTSMSCPHVSGSVALVFASAIDSYYDKYYTDEPNGVWDVKEVRKKLGDTADDLYYPGRDVCYGWGLVDANEAADTGPAPPPEQNEPPTCTLTADLSSGEAPLTTTFSMSASDPDGTIASWELDVDNDGTAEYSGPDSPPATQSHTYHDPGTYTAELTVWDNSNEAALGHDTTVVTVTEPNNPPDIPSNPDPADGAPEVSAIFDLSWDGGDPNSADTVYYEVYFGETSPPEYAETTGTYPAMQTRITYDPGTLNTGTLYYWKIIAYDNYGESTIGPLWSFTTESAPPPDPSSAFYVSQDIPVKSGSIAGDYTDTYESNNIYEGIQEVKTGRFSKLEHKWTIDVPGGYTSYVFYVEAFHTINSEGDDFIFAYSIDDITYTNMVTVANSLDDNTFMACMLPNSLSGTVYIRVLDMDRTKGNSQLDIIYIDQMYIEASGTPPPNNEPNMHVDDISWSLRTKGKNKFLAHTITVMSESGAVSDATVSSTLTNLDTGESWMFSGVTDANGQVTFERKCNTGNYEAEVIDITHTIYTYNSSDNLDNPDSYTLT